MPFDTMPFYTLPFDTIPFDTTSIHVTSFDTMSYDTLFWHKGNWPNVIWNNVNLLNGSGHNVIWHHVIWCRFVKLSQSDKDYKIFFPKFTSKPKNDNWDEDVPVMAVLMCCWCTARSGPPSAILGWDWKNGNYIIFHFGPFASSKIIEYLLKLMKMMPS